MITPKRPTGFHEFLPADQLIFDKMVSTIRQTYERSGYAPIETPALELGAVLHAKEGGESAKQGYRFTKGDTDLALRFDLTIPLARYAAEHSHELVFPFRRYQIQDVWRAEKPQAGRYRQFYQCDIDIIGSDSIAADADILITIANTTAALGLNAIIRLSNRKIFSGILAARKLEKKATEILRLIDKLDKAGVKKIKSGLIELGLQENDAALLLEIAQWQGSADEVIKHLLSLNISHPLFREGIDELQETAKLLDAAGVSHDHYRIDLAIFRGFDYYTGMVFEIMLRDQSEVGSVGSGGRYDNLVGHYSKQSLPGVGGSIGLSRLFGAIKNTQDKKLPSSPAQALVVVFNEALLPYCFKVASELRKNNLNILIYPGKEKAGKQLGYADKLGIPFALLCGEDEEKNKTVTIKNMKTGEQQTVPAAKAASFLKKNT